MTKNEFRDVGTAKTNDSAVTGIDIHYSMFLGSPCKYGHGTNGKNLRYKLRGGCVECAKKLSHDRKHSNNRRDLTAIDAFNERQAEKDDYYD